MANKGGVRRARASVTPVTVHAVRSGIPTSKVEELRDNLHASQSDIERYLSIPRQTLARRRQSGRLSAAESDRVVRFGKLFERASELLGDRASAADWLKTPLPALDGETPLERATTELGAEQVNDLIAQLEHGIAV